MTGEHGEKQLIQVETGQTHVVLEGSVATKTELLQITPEPPAQLTAEEPDMATTSTTTVLLADGQQGVVSMETDEVEGAGEAASDSHEAVIVLPKVFCCF